MNSIHLPDSLVAQLQAYERKLRRMETLVAVTGGLAGLLTTYVLLFALPVSGWVMSSAGGFPVVYLGILQLPDLVAKNKPLFETMKEVHELLAYGLLGVVALHTLAALKHHFIDRDSVLVRMLPFLRPR